MKKKFLSAMLTIAMAGVCVLSAGTTVRAGVAEYNDRGAYNQPSGPASQDAVDADPTGNVNTASIDVQAQTIGGGDIVYSVKIEWGAMKFTYNYGSVWDPSSHTYNPAGATAQDGGWDLNALNEDNNKISVINNSNFPISAKFSYDANDGENPIFNAQQTSSSVNGMFHRNNNDLKDIVSSGAINTMNIPDETLELNMDHRQLNGHVYYENTSANAVNDYKANMFFSLVGKPDRGIGLSTMQSVGSIKVTITPADSVREVTAPTT